MRDSFTGAYELTKHHIPIELSVLRRTMVFEVVISNWSTQGENVKVKQNKSHDRSLQRLQEEILRTEV